MGSHWHLKVRFAEALPRRTVRALQEAIEATDRDADVVVYRDGIRGSWRKPLSLDMTPDAVRALVEQYAPDVEEFVFAPFKCADAECGCHDLGPDYGCSWARPPWETP